MADGTITLETKADEKGVKVGMKEIEASVKRMSSSVEGLGEKAKIALQKQLDSLSKLNNQYGQQEQKVEALRRKLKELSDQKIETEEYKRLGAEIKKLDNEFEKVEQKQREWLDMGFPADSMKNLDDQLDEIWAKMDKLQKKQAEMKSSGIAYVDPRSLSEYQSTASRLTVEEMRLDDMNNRLNTSFATTEMKLKECGEEAARSSSKFSGLAESARRFAEKLKQSGITGMKQKLHELWQALDKLMLKFMQLASRAIVGGLQKISSGIFGIHKSANKSTLSLKKLMKYVFGIRTLFALFNRIRSAATARSAYQYRESKSESVRTAVGAYPAEKQFCHSFCTNSYNGVAYPGKFHQSHISGSNTCRNADRGTYRAENFCQSNCSPGELCSQSG